MSAEGDASPLIQVPPEVAANCGVKNRATGRAPNRDLEIPAGRLSPESFQEIVEATSPEAAPPLVSKAPAIDSIFYPLKGDGQPPARLPKPSEDLKATDGLSIRTLAQIQRKKGRDRSCLVGLSPGTDLFDGTSAATQRGVLAACDGAEATVLICTAQPENVPENFPDSVYIGAQASRPALPGVEAALADSGADPCWISYEITPEDFKAGHLPLSDDTPIDWVICHGPGAPVPQEQHATIPSS